VEEDSLGREEEEEGILHTWHGKACAQAQRPEATWHFQELETIQYT
jgi:hypothetical protein